MSPSWWTDLWLNEGFASWFECIGKNFTHPQWADVSNLPKKTFIIYSILKFEYFFKNDNFFVNKIPTMTRDSLDSTHSVRFEVFNPGEIKNLFDDISYHKVSCHNLRKRKVIFCSLIYFFLRARVLFE